MLQSVPDQAGKKDQRLQEEYQGRGHNIQSSQFSHFALMGSCRLDFNIFILPESSLVFLGSFLLKIS